MVFNSRKLMSFAAIIALAGQVGSTAMAADMLADSPEYTNVEFGTGWYLRGDIGAGIIPANANSDFGGGDFDLGSPISVSVSAGRTYAEGFRLEANFNHFNGLSGSSRNGYSDCGTEDHDSNPATANIAVTGDCAVTTVSNLNAASLMANVYMDFSQYWGVRPYVGAGLGAALVSWSSFNWTDTCTGTVTTDCGTGGGIGTNTRDSGSFAAEENFTYAANIMAGVSYEISKEVTLDLGYRYTYLGDIGFADTATSSGRNIGAMDMHEVRVGVRYEIW